MAEGGGISARVQTEKALSLIHILQNPTELLVDENGCVKGARVIKMELGEPDASGRRSPVEILGSEYEIEADTVIM